MCGMQLRTPHCLYPSLEYQLHMYCRIDISQFLHGCLDAGLFT